MENNLMKMMELDCEKTVNAIVKFIREKVTQNNRDGIVLGLSGGLDSATVLALSVLAVRPQKVWALYLPDRSSDVLFFKRCQRIATDFRVHFKTINIEQEISNEMDIYKSLPVKITELSALLNRLLVFLFNRFLCSAVLKDPPFVLSLRQQTTDGKRGISRIISSSVYAIESGFNARHRQRRKILERFAQENNLLLLGAANRSELFVGWFVKGGIDDLPVSLLTGLYKNQVRQIAYYLGLSEELINQPPSPDMLKGITDEDIIGVSYDKIDKTAYVIEHKLDKQLAYEQGVSPKEFKAIEQLHRLSSWKRHNMYESPPLVL